MARAQSRPRRVGSGWWILRLGLALETSPVLAAEKGGPFDLIFIDADKPNTAPYFRGRSNFPVPALSSWRTTSRAKERWDAASDDPAVQGMRRFLSVVAAESRVCATVLQTVGSKGYDGFALAVVL